MLARLLAFLVHGRTTADGIIVVTTTSSGVVTTSSGRIAASGRITAAGGITAARAWVRRNGAGSATARGIAVLNRGSIPPS